MSREELIKPADVLPALEDETSEPLHLQLNVTVQLDEIAQLEAARLKQLASRKPGRRELHQLAGRIYDARRTRDKIMGDKLFGEPAWDMMLALYCLPPRGELLGVTSLTYAAGLASATGHRWQRVLTEQGLIERGPPNVDARKQIMRLTTKGRTLLEHYLTRLFYCDAPTPLHPDVIGG